MHNSFAALSLLLASFATAWARPIPTRNIPDLANRANVIVLGRIVSTREAGVETLSLEPEKPVARVVIGQLAIHDVLKGTPGAPSIAVRYLLPLAPVGYVTPPVGTDRIFFLNRAAQQYSFTSPYYPALPGAVASEPASDNVIDRVISRIAAVIDSAATSPDDKAQAVWALGDIPGDKSVRAIQDASHRAEPNVWPIAVAMLLKRGDISGLQTAVDFLLHSADRPSTEAENLRIGIAIGVKDPGAVPILSNLLMRGNAPARRAAAAALSRTASASAIDPLAEALNDSDYEVRYYAVLGLADITGQRGHRPNGNALAFRDRGAADLDYWRDWARRR